MKSFKLIAFLLSTVVIVSCERDVNVTIPYDGDKIVLNTIMLQDSNIYVQVFKTAKLSQNYNGTLPVGTVVKLFENGSFVQDLILKNIYGKNYFTSTVKAKQNGNYTIKATANNLPAAEGQDILPSKPNCKGVSHVYTPNNSNNNIANTKVQIKINDNGSQSNYYALRLYSADTNTASTGPRYKVDNSFGFSFTADVLSNASSFGSIFGADEEREVLFTDENFNGKEITVALNFNNYNSINKYVAVDLVALSQSAYRYLVSVRSQQNNQGNPFAEVTVVYNNIKNGYGIVAGTADSIMVVKKQ
jgi:Domain of unknown function (DUF4249)